jgi:hypothetical protein
MRGWLYLPLERQILDRLNLHLLFFKSHSGDCQNFEMGQEQKNILHVYLALSKWLLTVKTIYFLGFEMGFQEIVILL